MIVVSASMPRSGGALVQGLTANLLEHHGIRHNTRLDDVFDLDGLVFSHGGPIATQALMDAVTQGHIRATYVYRDPRDAMVAAVEHGARERAAGREPLGLRPPANPLDLRFEWLSRWLPAWGLWTSHPRVLKVRLEELVADPMAVMYVLDAYLELGTDEAALREIATGRKSPPEDAGWLHQRRLGRHRDILTLEEQQLLLDAFGPWLEAMGYETTLTAQEGPGLAAYVAQLEAPPRRAPSPPPRGAGLTPEQVSRI